MGDQNGSGNEGVVMSGGDGGVDVECGLGWSYAAQALLPFYFWSNPTPNGGCSREDYDVVGLGPNAGVGIGWNGVGN